MKYRVGSWVSWVLLVAGIGVSSLAIAQGGKENKPAPTTPEASARQRIGYAPDPTPIRAANQWVLTFEYHRGKVTMRNARLVRLPKPVSTPRRMGRYAVELLSGPTVVERLRFDFPLLGADELAGQKRPYHAPPHFEKNATVTHRVLLPDTSRASRARLVDRATGESFMIPWPPNQPAPAVLPPGRPKPDAAPDQKVDAYPDAVNRDVAKDVKPGDSSKRPDVGGRRDAGAPDAIPLDGTAAKE